MLVLDNIVSWQVKLENSSEYSEYAINAEVKYHIREIKNQESIRSFEVNGFWMTAETFIYVSVLFFTSSCFTFLSLFSFHISRKKKSITL